MSTSEVISVAPLPTTEEVALTLLQWLFATIGVPTDYNIGSIVRTYSEAIGSVEEIEGISAQAQAVQAMVFAAYSVFGISPLPSTAAQGIATFSTLSSTPLPPGISVNIPLGTIIATQSGTQFTTTSATTLVSGTSSVNATIAAVNGGSTGNVNANTINQIITGLAYPLGVNNPATVTGGQDAESASQTLGRFLAYVYSLGLCSPIAIASAAIGVAFGNEQVEYATCFEGWIDQVVQGLTPQAGFQVYIDNGTGNASGNLINAVTTYLSSGTGFNAVGQAIGNNVGYRPAGVPFAVLGVQPIQCSMQVIAGTLSASLAPQLTLSITAAINNYFEGLNFGDTAQLTGITAAIADVSFGQLTSLSINLFDATNTAQESIPPVGTPILGYQRVILTNLGVTVN